MALPTGIRWSDLQEIVTPLRTLWSPFLGDLQRVTSISITRILQIQRSLFRDSSALLKQQNLREYNSRSRVRHNPDNRAHSTGQAGSVRAAFLVELQELQGLHGPAQPVAFGLEMTPYLDRPWPEVRMYPTAALLAPQQRG